MFTSLLRDMRKDPVEELDGGIHRARTGRILRHGEKEFGSFWDPFEPPMGRISRDSNFK